MRTWHALPIIQRRIDTHRHLSTPRTTPGRRADHDHRLRHGGPRRDRRTGRSRPGDSSPAATAHLHDCRRAYADTLVEITWADERLVVANDSIGSSNLGGFREELPARLVSVGIAEQNQVGVAAGMENDEKIPVASCAGSFLSARATEQITFRRSRRRGGAAAGRYLARAACSRTVART